MNGGSVTGCVCQAVEGDRGAWNERGIGRRVPDRRHGIHKLGGGIGDARTVGVGEYGAYLNFVVSCRGYAGGESCAGSAADVSPGGAAIVAVLPLHGGGGGAGGGGREGGGGSHVHAGVRRLGGDARAQVGERDGRGRVIDAVGLAVGGDGGIVRQAGERARKAGGTDDREDVAAVASRGAAERQRGARDIHRVIGRVELVVPGIKRGAVDPDVERRAAGEAQRVAIEVEVQASLGGVDPLAGRALKNEIAGLRGLRHRVGDGDRTRGGAADIQRAGPLDGVQGSDRQVQRAAIDVDGTQVDIGPAGPWLYREGRGVGRADGHPCRNNLDGIGGQREVAAIGAGGDGGTGRDANPHICGSGPLPAGQHQVAAPRGDGGRGCSPHQNPQVVTVRACATGAGD